MGGGCVLVAANTKQEAVEAYLHNEGFECQWWYYGDAKPDEDLGNIDFYVYALENWELIANMSYECDAPTVILEESYRE